MQSRIIALLIASALMASAPSAEAQRSARGPSSARTSAPVTRTHYRHKRDFDRYRRATHVRPAQRVWVPGHYETRAVEVVVPGCTERRWVPARFETRYDACGRRFQVQVTTGYWKLVRGPDRIEIRNQRVWVPAHWKRC